MGKIDLPFVDGFSDGMVTTNKATHSITRFHRPSKLCSMQSVITGIRHTHAQFKVNDVHCQKSCLSQNLIDYTQRLASLTISYVTTLPFVLKFSSPYHLYCVSSYVVANNYHEIRSFFPSEDHHWLHC